MDKKERDAIAHDIRSYILHGIVPASGLPLFSYQIIREANFRNWGLPLGRGTRYQNIEELVRTPRFGDKPGARIATLELWLIEAASADYE